MAEPINRQIPDIEIDLARTAHEIIDERCAFQLQCEQELPEWARDAIRRQASE